MAIFLKLFNKMKNMFSKRMWSLQKWKTRFWGVLMFIKCKICLWSVFHVYKMKLSVFEAISYFRNEKTRFWSVFHVYEMKTRFWSHFMFTKRENYSFLKHVYVCKMKKMFMKRVSCLQNQINLFFEAILCLHNEKTRIWSVFREYKIK